MKRSTRKFSKVVNRNTRKSNKKYIKKRRKYTQKGRGLDRKKPSSAPSSAPRSLSKYSLKDLKDLREELGKRKDTSAKINNNECPICLEELLSGSGLTTISSTQDEIESRGVCQPCMTSKDEKGNIKNGCGHPFHTKCVVDYFYSQKGVRPCPFCRSDQFKIGQRRLVDNMESANRKEREEEETRAWKARKERDKRHLEEVTARMEIELEEAIKERTRLENVLSNTNWGNDTESKNKIYDLLLKENKTIYWKLFWLGRDPGENPDPDPNDYSDSD
jgi:hypothetical protein